MGKIIDYQQIATEVLGSSATEEDVIGKYKLNIEADALIEEMLDQSVEYCGGCGTWLESCEIDDEEQNVTCFTCTGREIE